MTVDDAIDKLREAIKQDLIDDGYHHYDDCNHEDCVPADEHKNCVDRDDIDYTEHCCSHCHGDDGDSCPDDDEDEDDSSLIEDVRGLLADLPLLTSEQVKERLEEMLG